MTYQRGIWKRFRRRFRAALRAWRNPLLAAAPEEGVLSVQISLREAMASGALPTTLESRGRLINYATSAAAVAVSQTVRERFPIKWEPGRLARIKARKERVTHPDFGGPFGGGLCGGGDGLA